MGVKVAGREIKKKWEESGMGDGLGLSPCVCVLSFSVWCFVQL